MTPRSAAAVAEGPARGATALVDALTEALAPERLDGAVPAAWWDRALGDPVRELVRRPGKQLRGRLAEVAWVLAGGRGAVPAAVPLVVEGLHAGSLIIDDIQDDAHERRGAPALHRIYGAPLAINTGNWLYFWALAQLDAPSLAGVPAATRAAMHRQTVATLLACHHGQALDLTARAADLDPARAPAVVAAITRGKTAALMGLGPRLAALAANAGDQHAAFLGQLGEDLGTGLQMLDDLGGLAAERRAKGLEDLRGGRATWPWAWAAERLDHVSYARLQHRLRHAASVPAAIPGSDDELAAIGDALHAAVADLGRARAHAVLAGAVARTRAALGDSPALHALAADVRRLEATHG